VSIIQHIIKTANCLEMFGAQVKCGYLLHYKKRMFGRNWTEKVVALFSDSRIAWFKDDQGEVEDTLLLSDAPELLAAGQWVWRIPNPPALPTGACPKLAIAMGQSVEKKAHWFLCRSQDDLIDWMKAINSTLPLPPPPPELYPSVIKPLDPQLTATLETLCQASYTLQLQADTKYPDHDILTQCCRESSSCMMTPKPDPSTALANPEYSEQTSSSLKKDLVRSELQILKNRKVGPDSKNIEEGGEVMMMAGVATEWEWGWGSGGGWLCEGASCDYCVDGGVSEGGEMFNCDVDDDPDCELGDADAGADFGDFGF